ncbi:methyl-accepting chemotaxis protein [Aromatoleum toluvorans]|uniref:Methyl-accepting chemotaxis protein n=1 Tax=Aromatoleum toluvorans TaxID=92002 RepID=A0ABX1Q5E2_9RHOO|nr:methyl-accepting chemotaxis protein [Aromatoleum toluvorans]NMG45740.1 methyl-accepting chemotaxis protein [Aromatoleum toluvorans]
MALKLPTLNFKVKKKANPERAPVATTIMEAAPPRRSSEPAAAKGRKQQTQGAPNRFGALATVFALASIAGLGLLYYQYRESGNATAYIAAAGEMETTSQRIAKAAQLALQGNEQAFVELRAGTNRFTALLDALLNGGSIEGRDLPAAPANVQPQVEALAGKWRPAAELANQLIAQEKNLVVLNREVATINQQNEALFEQSRRIAQLRAGGNARDIAATTSGIVLPQRIAKNANALLVANAIDPETAFALGKDAKALGDVINELRAITTDAEGRRLVHEYATTATETLDSVDDILKNIQTLVQAKKAGSEIFGASEPLSAAARDLSATLSSTTGGLTPATLGIALAAIVGLLALSRMAQVNTRELAARQQEAEQHQRTAESERNIAQQAILRLMNEMGDLADGDLTVRTTVSEDITGAIADSVNYTIEELSVLVRRINDAATRVTQATESAQKTSTELLGATERQSREIEEVGATVEQMARTMTESSERALRSAQVARRSLESARKGAGAVENTIKGMNGIREQIQETSKRIKRLGESSQEIGEIVELISDITEQTNVLALNAAIQAASAGEAGRGFTVVAEEVQRLAERSAEATKQIAAIVKTIQTDTKDAVGSMENATRDVVEGAQLSDAAGQALAEIGEVSTEAARLIEQISSDTQHQAATATRVAETMKEILAITEQTATGTRQTAVSVGQLADLAVELKGSVSGFKV